MKKKEQPPITLADAERQLRQAQHRLQREENKKAYQRSKKEKERAHRLITRGAEIEHFFPEIKCLTEREFCDLAEMLHDIRISFTPRFLSSFSTESQYLELSFSPIWIVRTSFIPSQLIPRIT